MLAVAYKEYLSRRRGGTSKSQAREFDKDFWKSNSALENWQESDISDSVCELGRNGFLQVWFGGACELTDFAIATLEDRFKDGLKDVTLFLSQLIPMVK